MYSEVQVSDLENNATASSKISASSWKHQTKHSLQWKNITRKVPLKNSNGTNTGTKLILDSISGQLYSGNMLAIMGPSGSGKTTLLDVLANHESRFEGEILLDGSVRANDTITSYVSQEDSLLGSFSTRETLLYTAALTLPHAIGLGERQSIVSKMITDLGLDVCADTRVGDVFQKGLSGGQKRRLSLGLSLITRPAILVLDEPTSGLDAASAHGIMGLLSRLSKEKNIAVICTIHQPSTDIWDMFDQLALLSTGKLVYFGSASQVVPYFSVLGHSCPQYTNPADFLLSLINTDFEGHADISVLASALVKSNESNPASPSAVTTVTGAAALEVKSEGTAMTNTSGSKKNPMTWQFIVLLHRNFLNTVRNPGVILIRLVMYSMLAIMIGAMFLDNGNKSTDKAISGRLACLFFVFAFMVFMSIAVLPFYMWDRVTYLRECLNNDYEIAPFVLAQVFSTVPGVFLIALVSSIIIVYMCSWSNFGYFLLIMFLSLMCAEGYMAVLGAIVPHFIIGIALGSGLYGCFMLCEGFFQIKSDIPPWFIWIHYMAFHTYSFRAAVVNEFSGIDSLPDATNPLWQSGKDVLEYYSMENGSVSDDCWVLFGYSIAWFVLYYLILLKTYKKHN